MELAKLREKRGYTQKELAEKLNIPTSTYNQYEKGNRAIPAEIVTKICEILKIKNANIFLAKSFTLCETKKEVRT